MKPFIYLLAATILAAPTAFAGTLKVNREFTIVRSFEHDNYQRKEWEKDQLTLTPGVKNFDIRTSKTYRAGFCVPPFCRNAGEYIPYMELSLRENTKRPPFGIARTLGEVEIAAKHEYANNSTVYRASDTGQSFDIYEREAKSERVANRRTEVQECQEQDACYRGGLPFMSTRSGYGSSFGSRCSYLVGKQQVTLQDRIYVTRTQMKFVGAGGQVLATYDETSEDSREEVVSQGACRLNRDRR